MTPFLKIILVGNIVWFFSGFVGFGVRPKKIIRDVRRDFGKDDERAMLVAASIRFLGGMNLAFVSLSVMTLYFCWKIQNMQLCQATLLASALAHATQFGYNVPVLLKGGVENGGPWNVLEKPMIFIFVVDFSIAILNLVAFFCL